MSYMDKSNDLEEKWFVMRDLKRANTKCPAYKLLQNLGMKIFTPMKWVVLTKNNKKIRREIPIISDLLFVHDSKSHLDVVLQKNPTLQYRFQKGKGYQEPMVVRNYDMDCFIKAVSLVDHPVYFLPEELNESFLGHEVRIIGGILNGYEGRLLRIRGSRKKRVLVELPNWISIVAEVSPEYVEVLK